MHQAMHCTKIEYDDYDLKYQLYQINHHSMGDLEFSSISANEIYKI